MGLVGSLWGDPFMGWSILSGIGASGGMLILWDKRTVDFIKEVVGSYSITCKYKNILDLFVWAFLGVYVPNVDYDRRLLWEELSGVLSWWEIPCYIGGDFKCYSLPKRNIWSVPVIICYGVVGGSSASWRFLYLVQ